MLEWLDKLETLDRAMDDLHITAHDERERIRAKAHTVLEVVHRHLAKADRATCREAAVRLARLRADAYGRELSLAVHRGGAWTPAEMTELFAAARKRRLDHGDVGWISHLAERERRAPRGGAARAVEGGRAAVRRDRGVPAQPRRAQGHAARARPGQSQPARPAPGQRRLGRCRTRPSGRAARPAPRRPRRPPERGRAARARPRRGAPAAWSCWRARAPASWSRPVCAPSTAPATRAAVTGARPACS
ncbi:hypothetical protein ACFSTC_18935 [Nonomuraea ferruginea]